MIDALHQFQDRIDQLLAFLDDTEVIEEFVASDVIAESRDIDVVAVNRSPVRLRSSKLNRRIQSYVTAIILLYGSFEQYVEEAQMAYLEELDTLIDNFGDMPEKIRENHTILSAQLLMNRELDKYRERFSVVEVVQRMHACITGGPFRLNALAFIDHKSNFRVSTLNQFFDAIGISGISNSIKQEPEFREYCEKRFPDQEIDRMPDRLVFDDLDDLAWRRNVVAHGWPDDTLSIDMLKERASFILMLGRCIYQILRQDTLAHMVKYRGYELPTPIAVFNNEIVCFRLDSGTISTGSLIAACGPTGRFSEGRIVRLEVHHIAHESVTAPPCVEVGCQLNFRAKPNQKYYLIEEPASIA